MKKIFTLISMAFVAMSMNAQEMWDVSDILSKSTPDGKYDLFQDGKITSLDNANENYKQAGTSDDPLVDGTTEAAAYAAATSITLKDYIIEGGTANCTLRIYSTPNHNENSTAATAFSISDQTGGNNALSTEDCLPAFNVYISPKGNPTKGYFGYWVEGSNGASFKTPDAYQGGFYTAEDSWVPTKGAYVEIKVKTAGAMRIGIRLPKAGKNRKVFFVKKSDGSKLAVDQYSASGFDNNNTTGFKTFTTTADYVITPDVNNQFLGYVDVTLPANETYLMFSPDTQIGIYGFYFAPDGGSGIANVKAAEDVNAPIYNLAGQKVDKNQKGILIQNGKKFVNK
ncbi:MAG: hypothetical protein IJV17_00165 [Prevotella sp.]|nr:hypothetical protein [Prevotella sp.]